MEIATGFDGLQKHPTFEQLINFIQDDPAKIKYPDRALLWAQDNPFLTQLDDDWQDETIAPRHAQLAHQLWLATQKRSNPAAVYDLETGSSAALGELAPFSLSIQAIEDLAEQSALATTLVTTTDSGIVATIPGVHIEHATETAVKAETGGLWSLFGRAKGPPPPSKPPVEVLGYKPPVQSTFAEGAAPGSSSSGGTGGSSSSGLARSALGAAASAASSAASAAVTGAGVVGTAAGVAASAVNTVAGVTAPMVDALGGMVGTGLQGLDALLTAVVDPVMEGIMDTAKEEARGMMRNLAGLGPGGEPAPFEGTLLPYQVLNGEVPGHGRQAIGTGGSRSSGRSGGPSAGLPVSYGPARETPDGYPLPPVSLPVNYGAASSGTRRSGRSGGSRRRTDTP